MPGIKDKMTGLLSKLRGDKPVALDVVRKDDGTEARREVTIAQLKEGYGEVVGTMQAIRGHLDDQKVRQDRMEQMLSGLPEVLRAVPEAARTQTQLVKAIGAHLETQSAATGQLTEAIHGLSNNSRKQDQTLEGIAEHLVEERETKRELNTSVLSLNAAMEGVEASNLAARDALAASREEAQRREERLVQMHQRGQRNNTLMLVFAAALFLAVIAAGIWLVSTGALTLPAAPASG
ncbi:hypothetical protein [Phycisphaera mikurensis]|uniref:Uncharacterized protein n=1 Tax=Phycisphaera mikurensis (strain NBRC 102666 / KCTC 22515 / FYK2301M01) TaxID=1142394 RepID=I0IB46_PHYMF|nr:hypothetical protein [Phycisphaera mikurensis]MBB6442985.1 chromosome segregation ATPase [Phycisphaera mikurensis]BAM02484.1 hypothetical protein PSMK_03250 [Phycisphaera mikurensis NBRC 102666]